MVLRLFVIIALTIKILTIEGQLGFSNTTFNCPQEMLSNFINFANSATAFYKEDVKANLIYLKQSMERLYRRPNTNFYVFIQTSTALTNYVIGSNGFAEASVNGINHMYPQWSYYFIMKQDFSVPHYYLANGIIGDGINPTNYKLIQTSIKLYETGPECNCSKLNEISQYIFDLTGYFWQLLCDNKGVTHGYAQVFKESFGTFKPKSCYYTLFMGS